MAIVNTVNFAFPGGSAPFNVTVTDSNGPGVSPTAIIVLASGHSTLSSYGQKASGAQISFGLYDFTTYRVVGGSMEDAASSSSADTAYRNDTATVVQLPASSSSSLSLEATVTSVGANSVTLTADAANTYHGAVIFIYGAGVHAAVETLTGASSIGGTVSSTALGRTPDVVIAASVAQSIAADSGGNEYMLSLGWAARHSSTQGCMVSVAEHQASPKTSVGSIAYNNRVAARLTNSPAENAQLELTSWNSDGFTLTTRNTAASLDIIAISISGVKAAVANETIAAGTSGSKSITSPGFRAQTVLALTIRNTAFSNLSNTNNTFSIGCGNTHAQSVMAVWSQDNLSTSVTDSVAGNAAIIRPPTNGGVTAFDWVATWNGATANGFDIDVTTAAGGNRVVTFLVFGLPKSHPYIPEVWRQQRRRLVRM